MKLHVPPDALLSRSGERSYLTQTSSGRVFELNESARIVFEAAREEGTTEAAARALLAHYPDVAPVELARDAAALVDELSALGVIDLEAPRSPA